MDSKTSLLSEIIGHAIPQRDKQYEGGSEAAKWSRSQYMLPVHWLLELVA